MDNKDKIFLDYQKHLDQPYLDQVFQRLNLSRRLKSANYVVIKPNFAAGTYVKADSHVVTDLKLIGKLIEYILFVDPKKIIYIAESDSTGFGFAFLKFENLKLPESLNISKNALKHVKLLDLSRDRLLQIENNQFLYFTNFDRQLWLSEILMKSDFVIDVTNLKSHSVTGFTGACKNLFGTLYPSEKWIFHTHITEIIHDLVLAVQPSLCIVDAFYGMEYNGPVAGKKVDAGFRVWSSSAVAADIVSCHMAGFNYKKIVHLKKLLRTTKINPQKIISESRINKDTLLLFHPPTLFLRITNKIGLFLQRAGEIIQYFGHRIHVTSNLLQILVAIVRPALMAILGRERLVKIKRKILRKQQ